MAGEPFVIPEAHAGKPYVEGVTASEQMFDRLAEYHTKVSTPPAFAIPDAYKDRPYVKGIDAPDKLWAAFDGAQTLIGKKGPAIPGTDAKPEEWNAFYEAIGRPKTAAEYVVDGADKADPKFLPRVQGAFHKAGLRPDQAKIVYGEVDVALKEWAKEKGIADAQQDTDFEKLALDTFGTEKDKVLGTGKVLISKYVPASMKSLVDTLPNESLIILAGVLEGIRKDYINEDIIPGAGGSGGGAQTAEQLSAEARALMLKPEYADVTHANHNAIVAQVQGIYEKMRTVQKK